MDRAIVMASTDGAIVHWDAGAESIFGYSPDEAIGQPVALIVPDDLRERHTSGFARVMEGGERHLVGAASTSPYEAAVATSSLFKRASSIWTTREGILEERWSCFLLVAARKCPGQRSANSV